MLLLIAARATSMSPLSKMRHEIKRFKSQNKSTIPIYATKTKYTVYLGPETTLVKKLLS